MQNTPKNIFPGNRVIIKKKRVEHALREHTGLPNYPA